MESLVVGLAQLVERQIVVLEVMGSNPISHPTPFPVGHSAYARLTIERFGSADRLTRSRQRVAA